MRHPRQMASYPRDVEVRALPDGRVLVTGFNVPAKVIDCDGNEIEPSPSELVALERLCEMSFPSLGEDCFAA
jgi:hypothetical protein